MLLHRHLLLVASCLAGCTLARSFKHVPRSDNIQLSRKASRPPASNSRRSPASVPRDDTIIPQNENTLAFAVNGSAIPNVTFDIGESYAGLLPISADSDASELYFWFFPSSNPQSGDEIVVWLNGGPGCSSLEGLLQENGPFLWQYGTFLPVQNQYTWVNLTNMVWVEQPAGTGFSQVGGTPPATNEIEVAAQFLGFWKNFVDTFGLHGRKVYLTGESYAGYYVSYIADAMHNASDSAYYNIDSIMIYDASLTHDVVQRDIPAVPFVDYWAHLFALNESFVTDIRRRADFCGYADFMEQAMTFPPEGPLPTPPNVDGSESGCNIWADIAQAAPLVNPCWDVYQVATTCPLLWDVLGFPGSFDYIPDGAAIYFNRSDVQEAINAPVQAWAECSDGVLETDESPPPALGVLPRVIEKNRKTIIGHGLLDFILISNGTLMAIQNMTWNGAQGFSQGPEDWQEFYVPYHSELSPSNLAGAGVFGKFHDERGLTFVTIDLCGHMVPQYAPSAAYRQLEYLLGRVESLGSRDGFTTQEGDFGNNNTFTAADASNMDSAMTFWF